jgi:hypothetical protein
MRAFRVFLGDVAPKGARRALRDGFPIEPVPGTKLSLSAIVLTRWDRSNASDATDIRACFGCELPRAEALGYGLEPLRGKIRQTSEVKVFARPNPGLLTSPHLPKHLSRFCQKRLHDRAGVVAAARQLDIG